jgi:hypothetical protein
LPVFPKVAENRREPGLLLKPVAFRYSSRSSLELVMDGELFFFAAFLLKA